MSSGAGSASAPSSLAGTPSTTSLAATTSATSATSANTVSYATNASVSAVACPYSGASASAAVLQDTDENPHESVLLQKLLDISRHRHHSLTTQILGDLNAYNSNMEQDLSYIIKQYINTKMSLEKSQGEVKRLEQINAELVSSKRIASSETQVGLGIMSHQSSNLMHSSGTLQQQLLHMGQLHFQSLQEQQSKLDAAASRIQEQQSKLDTAGCELQMTTQELIRALEDVELLKNKVASLEAQLEALDNRRTELESTNQHKLVVNQQLAGLLEARMRDLDVARAERDNARQAMDAAAHEVFETKLKFQYYQRMLAPYLMANLGQRQGQGHGQGQSQGQSQGQAPAGVSNSLLPSGIPSSAMPRLGAFPANGPSPNVPHIAIPSTSVPVGHAPPEGLLQYQAQNQLVLSSGMSGQTPPMISTTAMHGSPFVLTGTPSIAGSAPPASFLYTAPSAPPSNSQLNTSPTFYAPKKAPKAPKALKAPKPKGTASKGTKASLVINPQEAPAGSVTRVSFSDEASAPIRQPLAVIDLIANSSEAASPPQAALSSPSPLPSSSTAIPTTQPQPQPQAPTQPQQPPQAQAQTQLHTQTQPEPQPQPQLQPEKESRGSAHVSHLLQEQQLNRQLKQQEIRRLQIAIKEIAERSKLTHQAQQQQLNEREEQEHLKQIHETRIAAHFKANSGPNTPLQVASVEPKTAPGSIGAFIVQPRSGSSAPQGEKRQLEVDSGDEFENHRTQGGEDITSPKRVAAVPLPQAAIEKTSAASLASAKSSPRSSSAVLPSKPSSSKSSSNKPLPSKASSITIASFQPVTERIRTAKFPAFEAAPSQTPPPLPQRLLDSGLKKKKQRRSAMAWIVDDSEDDSDDDSEEEEGEKEDEEEDEGEEEGAEERQERREESSLQFKRPSHKRFKPKPGHWYATAVEIPVRPRRADSNLRSPIPSGNGAAEVGGGNGGVTRAVVAEKGTGDRRGSTTSTASSIGTEGTPVPRLRSLTEESSKSTGAGLSPSLVMRTANTASTSTSTVHLSQASKDVRAWVHALSDNDGGDTTDTEEEATEVILERGVRKTDSVASPVQVAHSSSSSSLPLDEIPAQATSPNDTTAPRTPFLTPRASSFLIKLSEAAAAKRNVQAGSLATIDLGLDGGGEGAMESDP